MTIQHVYTARQDGFVVAVDDAGMRTTGPYPASGPFADAVDGWKAAGGSIGPEPAPPIDLRAYAASARYAKETGGILVGNAPIATDRDSQALITGAFAFVQAKPDATINFKTSAGFVTLTAAQVTAIALAVGAHVQACFAAEAQVVAAISASPPLVTTTAQVDAAFAVVMA